MRRTKKIFWSAALVLLVLVIVAIVVAGFFLGNIAKAGIETVGSKMTKVSVKVGAVNLSLMTGSAEVKGFVVGNPQGYKTPQAISIGSAAIGIDPFSIFSHKIVVRSIKIVSPEITFEGGLSANNLSQILDNVNSAAQNGGPKPTNAAAAGKPAKNLEVDDFLITGAKVHVNLTGLVNKKTTLTLPNIHLTDLGEGSNGITAADLTRNMLDAINTATIEAVANTAANLGKGLQNTGKQDVNNFDNLKKGAGGLLGK